MAHSATRNLKEDSAAVAASPDNHPNTALITANQNTRQNSAAENQKTANPKPR
jgi:hypothetical protein